MIENAEQFVDLRKSEDPEEYGRAATDHAPKSVWMDVIRRFPEMKIWVVQNKTVPEDILELLATDPDDSVRVAVAMKRKLSGNLYRTLALDAADVVRERIAYNAKTPQDVLAVLANDMNDRIAQVAQDRISTSDP